MNLLFEKKNILRFYKPLILFMVLFFIQNFVSAQDSYIDTLYTDFKVYDEIEKLKTILNNVRNSSNQSEKDNVEIKKMDSNIKNFEKEYKDLLKLKFSHAFTKREKNQIQELMKNEYYRFVINKDLSNNKKGNDSEGNLDIDEMLKTLKNGEEHFEISRKLNSFMKDSKRSVLDDFAIKYLPNRAKK